MNLFTQTYEKKKIVIVLAELKKIVMKSINWKLANGKIKIKQINEFIPTPDCRGYLLI